MTVIILRRPKLGRSVKEVRKKTRGITRVYKNTQRLPNNLSLVFRWGTTSNVDCPNIVNTAEAIHRVNDKAGFRKTLMEYHGAGNDLLCPWTYNINDGYHVEYPIVVRPKTHAQGRHVYLCNNVDEYQVAQQRCGAGFYASAYINKVEEYRVTLVQGRVIWVAKKTPGNPQDVAWNVARGGRFDNVAWGDWPLRAVRVAREAFVLTGLDFGAVDVMVDAAGRPYVLEVNSAPSQTSPYRQECMAKAFDYIIENGKAAIPVTDQRGDWKKFIHPSLSPEAIMV